MTSQIFSIDLGLDWTLPRGGRGTYPLQVGLCKGTIANNLFTPASLASWYEFKKGDQVIVRVFDITAQPRSIADVSLDFLFREASDICAVEPLSPWSANAKGAFHHQEGNNSKCFPHPSSGLWPCHAELTTDGNLVISTVNHVDARQWFLMTIFLSIKLDDGSRRHYVEDPEMVVGPDSGGN